MFGHRRFGLSDNLLLLRGRRSRGADSSFGQGYRCVSVKRLGGRRISDLFGRARGQDSGCVSRLQRRCFSREPGDGRDLLGQSPHASEDVYLPAHFFKNHLPSTQVILALPLAFRGMPAAGRPDAPASNDTVHDSGPRRHSRCHILPCANRNPRSEPDYSDVRLPVPPRPHR